MNANKIERIQQKLDKKLAKLSEDGQVFVAQSALRSINNLVAKGATCNSGNITAIIDICESEITADSTYEEIAAEIKSGMSLFRDEKFTILPNKFVLYTDEIEDTNVILAIKRALPLLAQDQQFEGFEFKREAPTSERIQYRAQPDELTLYTEFESQLNSLDFSDTKEVTEELLSAAVEKARAVDSDYSYHQYTMPQAVKALREINLPPELSDLGINKALSEAYQNIKHCSEAYAAHLDDLHFSFIKVTPINYQNWRDFGQKAEGYIDGKFSNRVGITGFWGSIEYYDYPETEVWIAAAANKKLTSFNSSDFNAVEMIVPVLTSKALVSTSHSGIFRSAMYEGVKHKGISMKLHSFGAKIMTDRFPEKKYMINAPASNMGKIIFKALEKADKAPFVGYGQDIQEEVDCARMFSYDRETKQSVKDYNANCLLPALLLQLEKEQDGALIRPIDIEGRVTKASTTYQFNDVETGKKIALITPQDGSGAASCLFENIWVWGGMDKILFVSLDDLVAIINWDDVKIKHYAREENILDHLPILGPEEIIEVQLTAEDGTSAW